MSELFNSLRWRWTVGRKLKGKRLQEMVSKNWVTILTDDGHGGKLPEAPTAEEFRMAVAAHNAQYEQPVTQPKLWESKGPLETWADNMRAHKFDAEQWRREMHRGRGTGYTTLQTVQPAPQTDWTCDAKDLTSCPVVGEPIVEVPRWMYEEWVALADEVETEWITYLVGEMRPAGAVIESFYFPPQVAGGAHVAQPDDAFRPLPRTIGATHSHVRMAAFWSGTDEAHANWPVEIVVNAKGESKCRVRLKLDCARFARIDSKIKLTGQWERPSTWRLALQAALKAGEDAKEAAKAQSANQPAEAGKSTGVASQGLSQGPAARAQTNWGESLETDAELMDYYRSFGGGI